MSPIIPIPPRVPGDGGDCDCVFAPAVGDLAAMPPGGPAEGASLFYFAPDAGDGGGRIYIWDNDSDVWVEYPQGVVHYRDYIVRPESELGTFFSAPSYEGWLFFALGGDKIFYSTGTEWITLIDTSAFTTPTAAQVSYDNSTSGLTADDVQEALDELAAGSGGGGGGGALLGKFGEVDTSSFTGELIRTPDISFADVAQIDMNIPAHTFDALVTVVAVVPHLIIEGDGTYLGDFSVNMRMQLRDNHAEGASIFGASQRDWVQTKGAEQNYFIGNALMVLDKTIVKKFILPAGVANQVRMLHSMRLMDDGTDAAREFYSYLQSNNSYELSFSSIPVETP